LIIYIENEKYLNKEYQEICNLFLNNEIYIKELINQYNNLDTRKKGYKEKFYLMRKIDDILLEIWA
jgi:hypothetical protein